MSQGFSIVLCTFNGQSRLTQTLTHLAALQKPAGHELELVFVDNASTDTTTEFTKQTWQALGDPFPLVLLAESRAGKGFAVETGYDAATLPYILTVDDDNWLSDDYLLVATELFAAHSDISILQGVSEAVFELPPPAWLADPRIAKQLVIGGAFEKSGYFPKNYFYVWGAGLIFQREDWLALRRQGLSFLTSKLPGKAAGEDSELGLGLALMGRRAYYSTALTFKHFMPAGRLTWEKLIQNFEILGYVSYYMSLYAISIEAYQQQREVDTKSIRRYLLARWFEHARVLTLKQHIAYWVRPRQEYYQLMLAEYYARLKWINALTGNLENDIATIRKWILPLIEADKHAFRWP
jgi:glycosyltransferase involved in cell wall biosynthesis